MKRHCWNGPSPLGHRPPWPWWPSPRGLSTRGRDRGIPRCSTAASILVSSGMVRWARGSQRWPVRWGTRFGHWRRRRLTRGRFPWGRGSAEGERRWGVASSGGGQWLVVWDGCRDTSGHWGDIDGARWWPEAARRWSAMAKQGVGGRWVGAVRWREEEPRWEGIPPLQPRAMDKGALRPGTV
jgi:hypothetical protein